MAEEKPDKVIFVGSKGEAETELKSPYWGLSYDFPWNPDPLCSGNNYDIYDEMIDDDQVKSVLAIKKDMVVNTGWKISGESEKVNQYIEECFRHINEGIGLDSSFEDSLRDILSSYDYGFSLTEPVYAIEDGKYKYKTLRTRAPHSFRFEMDDIGNVTTIIQTTTNGDKKLSPSVFIHHLCQSQFGNPYGKSDLRGAYAAWKAKKFFLRFFAIYVERFASGTIVAKYPKNYGAAEIEELHTVVKSIQNATTLAIPDDTILDFVQMQRDASDVYLKGIDYYNMQIARSVLVPDLLGLGGSETKGGSYALGKEQFKVFLGTINKDRESLAKKITMKMVRPLVQANFGNMECQFEFLPYSHGDVEKYLEIWANAISGGVYVPPQEDIDYFRRVLGFPEIKISDQEPKKIKSPELEEEPEEEKFAYRELTQYEKKIDFNTIKETLDRNEERIISSLNAITRTICGDLIDQVREKGILKKFKPDALEQLEPKYLRPMNTILKNYFVDLFNESIKQAEKEIFPNIVKKYAFDLLPEQFLELLKIEAFKTVGDYSFNITKRGKNIVIQSIKDGIGEAETLRILREELKNETEKWTETVIRTKTTEIYNEARKKYWETDELAKQIVEAYQWSSVLDDRTSEICRYLDGKIFTVGELSDRVKPPAHFNCRSLLIPITKFEDYKENPESDFKEDKLKNLGGGLLKPGG